MSSTMLTVRACASVFFGALAMASAGLLLFTLTGLRSIDHTMTNNRKLDDQFARAAAFVEQFRTRHSRLPTSAEFEAQHTPGMYSMMLAANPASDEAVRLFGHTADALWDRLAAAQETSMTYASAP
jgi:hypothetical protein